ncbi:MAG: hypothetical protein GY719_04035 [bacterium]|nr:hypothetical protein [bacterium]
MARTGTLTKTELVSYVASTQHLLESDAELFVNAVFDGIAEALEKEKATEVRGFGSAVFSIERRPARGEVLLDRRAVFGLQGSGADRVRRLRGLAEVPGLAAG